jgi:hypothetical protein
MSHQAFQSGADPAVRRFADASNKASWNGLAPGPSSSGSSWSSDVELDAGFVESIVDHACWPAGVLVDPALVALGSRSSRNHERVLRALRALRMARARRLALALNAAVSRAP